MKRRTPLGFRPGPVLSTPHGLTVVHGWDWVQAHQALLQAVGLALGALLVVLVLSPVQRPPSVDNSPGVSAAIADPALHSYDTIEAMRAERRVLQGDRSYDAIEDLRAARLLVPLPTPDRSYDAIEELRANRDLGR